MEMMEERDFRRWIFEGATLDSGVFQQLLRLVSTTFRRAVHGWALWTFLKKGIAEFSFLPQKHKSSRKKKGDHQRGRSHYYTPGRFTKTRLQGDGHQRHPPGLRLKHSRKGLRRIIAFGMARSRWAGGIYIFRKDTREASQSASRGTYPGHGKRCLV